MSESLMAQQIKVLVTGSRDWTDVSTIRCALFEYLWNATDGVRPVVPPLLLHGAARGADVIAAGIWTKWNLPVKPFPVTPNDWRTLGKRAGHLRNGHMIAERPDVCLAFPVGESRGTRNCMAQAEAAGIPVKTFTPLDAFVRN